MNAIHLQLSRKRRRHRGLSMLNWKPSGGAVFNRTSNQVAASGFPNGLASPALGEIFPQPIVSLAMWKWLRSPKNSWISAKWDPVSSSGTLWQLWVKKKPNKTSCSRMPLFDPPVHLSTYISSCVTHSSTTTTTPIPAIHYASSRRLPLSAARPERWHEALSASDPLSHITQKHAVQKSPEELCDEWCDLYNRAAATCSYHQRALIRCGALGRFAYLSISRWNNAIFTLSMLRRTYG